MVGSGVGSGGSAGVGVVWVRHIATWSAHQPVFAPSIASSFALSPSPPARAHAAGPYSAGWRQRSPVRARRRPAVAAARRPCPRPRAARAPPGAASDRPGVAAGAWPARSAARCAASPPVPRRTQHTASRMRQQRAWTRQRIRAAHGAAQGQYRRPQARPRFLTLYAPLYSPPASRPFAPCPPFASRF